MTVAELIEQLDGFGGHLRVALEHEDKYGDEINFDIATPIETLDVDGEICVVLTPGALIA